jgi:antitoxin component YwqK of YwqJK toxin-antitoxin module
MVEISFDKTKIIYRKYSLKIDKKEKEKILEPYWNENYKTLNILKGLSVEERDKLHMSKELLVEVTMKLSRDNKSNDNPINPLYTNMSGEVKLYNNNSYYYTHCKFIEGNIKMSAYNSSGTIKFLEPYYSSEHYNFQLEGKIDGPLIKQRKDGTLERVINYIKGIQHGDEIAYFEDGKTPKYECMWKNNKQNGRRRLFHEPGILQYTQILNDDYPDGEMFEWYTNEQLLSHKFYENKHLVEHRHYLWNWKMKKEEGQENILGRITYYKNDKPYKITYYENNEIVKEEIC